MVERVLHLCIPRWSGALSGPVEFAPHHHHTHSGRGSAPIPTHWPPYCSRPGLQALNVKKPGYVAALHTFKHSCHPATRGGEWLASPLNQRRETFRILCGTVFAGSPSSQAGVLLQALPAHCWHAWCPALSAAAAVAKHNDTHPMPSSTPHISAKSPLFETPKAGVSPKGILANNPQPLSLLYSRNSQGVYVPLCQCRTCVSASQELIRWWYGWHKFPHAAFDLSS